MTFSSLLGVAVLLSAASANAAMVTYTTTGIFGASGTSILTSGDSTLTFVGTTATLDTPVGNNFGVFNLAGGQLSGSLNPFDSSFTLTFLQTAPTVGSSAVPGTVMGNVSFNSGILTYDPTLSSLSIANVTYTFDNPAYVLQVPAGSSGGVTTIQGTITGGEVPEPSTFALLGAGITALAVARRKRTA